MYSQSFKVNVNKLNADEALLSLVKIEHPFVSDPICLVNDNLEIDFLGERYIPMPFDIKKHDDVQGELPRVSLSVPNIGNSLMKWIDASGGGRNAKITVYLTRRTNPIAEEKLSFGISSVSVTTQIISFNLVIQNNLIKRATRWVYDIKHSRGLF